MLYYKYVLAVVSMLPRGSVGVSLLCVCSLSWSYSFDIWAAMLQTK